MAQRLVLEQLQVDAARQETSVASAKVAADAQAIAQLNQQLAADQRDLAQHLHVVQSQAIQSYIDSGADSSSSDTTLFAGGSARAQAASEYASLAVGNITTQMDQLHTAQHALQAQESALQARQAQDRADQARQSAALGRADAAAASLEAQQAQVTGQLAAAVSAQQAAQAKAAAAAVAKAPKRADPEHHVGDHRHPCTEHRHGPVRPVGPRHPRRRPRTATPTRTCPTRRSTPS